MILSITILLIIIFLLFKNYEYGIVLIISLNIWLDLFAIAGSNILTYSVLIALLLFPFKRKYHKGTKNIPAIESILLIAVSYIITGIFAEKPNIIPAILNSARESLILIIFFLVFKNNQQKLGNIFIKSNIIFALAFISITIIEFTTSQNAYINFINSINAYRVDTFVDTMRFGFKRCQSLFSMHTTLGGAALLICIPIAWYYYTINKTKYIYRIFFMLVSAIFCAYASGARSTILGCSIPILLFFNKQYLRPKYIAIIFIIVLSIYFVYNDKINEVIDSFIYSDSVGGSDENMRFEQLAISLSYLKRNLLIGNGIYAWTDIAQKTNLYGAESIWFSLMIDRGLLGIISLIFFNIQLLLYIYKNKTSKIAIFLLAFLLTNSLTSLPNIIYSYIYAPIIVMISLSKRKKKSISSNKNNRYEENFNYNTSL